MMLRSANSAAVVLAEACAGSVEAFADDDEREGGRAGHERHAFRQSQRAGRRRPLLHACRHGPLARYAMQNEKFRKIVQTEEYTVQLPGRDSPLEFKNTNKLLGQGQLGHRHQDRSDAQGRAVSGGLSARRTASR